MSTASPFNPRFVIGLIAAGIAAFAALLLLLAYGGGLGTPRGGSGANVQSVAATGFKGLVTLADSLGETRIVRSASELGENLLVVTIEERTSAADFERMQQLRTGRATLFILPKWATLPDPARRGWVRAIGPGVGSMIEGRLGKGAQVTVESGDSGRGAGYAVGTDFLDGMRVPLPRAAQLIRGAEIRPLLAGPGDRALLARLGDQPHYLLADPDLVSNHGLRDPQRARDAIALLQALNSTDATGVDFDLTLTGLAAGSAPNALRLAFEPPFLVLTLALFVAALLAGLHGAFRFGPVRREERTIAFGKAALVENSAGLIRLAGREARLGAAYADVVRHEAARAASAPAWLQGEALDRYLDRLGRSDGPNFSALASQLDSAQGRHSLMAAARALFQWKKDIIP